jgi:hypothetical protein
MNAEEVIVVKQGDEDMRVVANDEIFLHVAKDIDWLLTHRVRHHNREDLRQYYIGLLLERRLVAPSGQVYLYMFAQQFVEFFCTDVLQYLGCEIDLATNNHWLAQLIMTSAGARHPLEYILLMRFLGQDIRTCLELN